MKELDAVEVGKKVYEIDEDVLSVFSYQEGHKYRWTSSPTIFL